MAISWVHVKYFQLIAVTFDREYESRKKEINYPQYQSDYCLVAA